MSQPRDSASPESPTLTNGDHRNGEEPPLKRQKLGKDGPVKTTNTRRKTACQSCRMRKVKCDAVRPTCGICLASEALCIYSDPLPEKLTIDSATELLSKKLDTLQDGIERIHKATQQSGKTVHNGETNGHRRSNHTNPDLSRQSSAVFISEPSKDFLTIPAARTTCDTVLTWPIYEGKYGPSHLIQILFTPPGDDQKTSTTLENDSFVVAGGLLPPNEASIPFLVDIFLENVHTKNPVVDVEQLVKQSRLIAQNGLGWDPWSCLVLLASALGTIAKPFEAAVTVAPTTIGGLVETTWLTDAPTTQRELQQAESLFVLACRRIGCLKNSILGAHCHFFAGVYLMYTLRPLLSWQYFIQASILYQTYMKTTHRVASDISLLGQIPIQQNEIPDTKLRRLEQSMYWSCFKSESEFRVELPLPQTELSQYYHPHLFPSPPSPAGVEKVKDPAGDPDLVVPSGEGTNGVVDASAYVTEAASLREHAKQLCNEEESWYYYLTEIALRRIGNRIINTFFNQNFSASWLDIKPWLSIALEFDTQVSAWSANLPAAMQHWEMNYTIRAPNQALPDGPGSHVSRELSWATDNRLLEMRSWLYQPFLYWFIHSPDAATINEASSRTPSLEEFVQSAVLWRESLEAEDATALYNFITSGIECNLKILDVRSLRHRHHGLWYDMRSLMTASLILLAIVQSGHEAWIPGGAALLWGYGTPSEGPDKPVSGKIGHILDEFNYWTDESPDLKHHRETLEEVTKMIRRSWLEQTQA